MKKKAGLTLIELLMAIGAIMLLGGLSIPYFMSFQVSSESDAAGQEIIQSLRRAKIKAIAAENDDNWGLAVKNQKITIFKGSIFDSRDQSFDEAFDLPPTITAFGLTELYFNKLSGIPSAVGTINLLDTGLKQKNISINANGTADFQ